MRRMRGRRRLRTAALLVVLPLLAATGCGAGGSTGGSGAASSGLFETHVDVNTPQLRQVKREAGIEPCEPSGAAPVQGGLPRLTLPCLGGGPDVDLASLRGPMVINVWAQWCGPCREELPYYQRLHEQAADRLSVVGIDWQDTQPGRALELAQESGVTYPLLADPAARTRGPLPIHGLPSVVFVRADGTVSDTVAVAIHSYDQLRDLVEQHLDVQL